jgi:hypothetical protein
MSSRWSPLASPRRMFSSTIALAVLALTGGMAAAVSAQAATLPTVSIAINPSSIAVGGTLQSGAVNVVTSASGVKEGSPVLFLLKPGVSVAEFNAYLATGKPSKDPNTSAKFGTIVFDAEAAVGKANEAQTTLQPGQYVAFNAEGEKSATWTHTSFTVTTAASPAVLPTPQATEKTIDFDFRGPTVLHVGELVRFENEGYVVHMDLAFPVKSKKAALKVMKALLTGHEKGLEKLAAGPPANFAGPLSTGAFQQETITAKPGWYVQVCFMPTQEGVPHSRLGMERIIKIVK